MNLIEFLISAFIHCQTQHGNNMSNMTESLNSFVFLMPDFLHMSTVCLVRILHQDFV